MFRAVCEVDTPLQTKRHRLILAHQPLTDLQKTPHSLLGADIEISEEDHFIFRLRYKKMSQISIALKYINSRKEKTSRRCSGGRRTDIDKKPMKFRVFLRAMLPFRTKFCPDYNSMSNPDQMSTQGVRTKFFENRVILCRTSEPIIRGPDPPRPAGASFRR
jgi:hypothetical protein